MFCALAVPVFSKKDWLVQIGKKGRDTLIKENFNTVVIGYVKRFNHKRFDNTNRHHFDAIVDFHVKFRLAHKKMKAPGGIDFSSLP